MEFGFYKPRWFARPQTVTHPSTNRARRRVTSLIETNALPLSQAASSLLCDILLTPGSSVFLLRVFHPESRGPLRQRLRDNYTSCTLLTTQRHCRVRTEELQKEKEKYKVVNTELDATFAELTGF